MHHDEPGLFMLPDATPIPLALEPLITEPQITSVREAFASAGIHLMQERQELIQSCTARTVGNIRELYARDVRLILKRIQERSQIIEVQSGSAWDNRDWDTWIDKL